MRGSAKATALKRSKTFHLQAPNLFLLLGVLACGSAPVSERKPAAGFLPRTVRLGTSTYRYQVYVPPNYSRNEKWPVILFLHGAGERGTDGVRQTEVGIGPAIRRYQERFPAVVVLPQCRGNAWWADPDMEAQALKALNQTVAEFNGDPQRLYLTGVSMGGYGTWHLAAKYPGRFAALVPVCGGSPLAGSSAERFAAIARKVGKTPAWVFHGAADMVVPVYESRRMVEALKVVGGNVRYTEYEGVGHNSWDRAYAEPSLVPWLLSNILKGENARPDAAKLRSKPGHIVLIDEAGRHW